MNINLKNYQEKAVGELIATFKTLLTKEEQKKVCVFQAPTGSGKTLMTAKFIEEIIREVPEMDLCFVWISIGKGELHLQSKKSLERVFGGAPRVSLVEEEFTGGRERIIRNEVVVVNWEKLRSKERETGDWKNILMKDGEKLNFRDVLSKTREQRKVIMIIDESHIGATAERTNELRDEINADVILEMSATPRITPDPRDLARGTAGYVFVEPKDVIDEGMIKKELIINEKIDEITDNEADSQEVVLEIAYKKRLELKKLFEVEKSNINPLVLVQIPTAEAGEDKIKAVKKFLADKGITERKDGHGNGKLAIWLAEKKSETLDWISEPDNEIEFLIFKQAIDTGWDCPRAHILVKFRESRSETFEIQTVGRILRMPEQKHYASEDLNRGYIYTNVQSIIVKKEEYNPNIIKHLKAVRKEVYKPIKLTSYYKSRADYGDITSSFSAVFEKTACEHFGLKGDHTMFPKNVAKVEKEGVILDVKKYQQDIIANAKIEGTTFDEIEGKIDSAARARLTIAGNDLQALFEQIIKERLGSFKNVKRSVPAVKTALYTWFRKYLGSKAWPEEMILVQMVLAHNGNRKQFEEILASAIEAYKAVREKEILKRVEESEQFYDFEIAKESFFNQHTDERVEQEKFVYEPCYLSASRLNPEKNFEKFLAENNDKIVWWWKNGENKQDYFGIKYEYPAGFIHTFYPDYLVQLADGRIGIIETKDMGDRDGGNYTKAKAEKLQEYIKEQKGKTLFGGIAIEKSDGWKINQKSVYDWNKCEKNDWSDWEKLNLE
ncbi:MAG: DEAD/DEAH box helicase family protein [Deltaproteobacteria bacterium]